MTYAEQPPVWDNSNIYSDCNAPKLSQDIEQVRSNIVALDQRLASVVLEPDTTLTNDQVNALIKLITLWHETTTNIGVISVFASCLTSVNSAHAQGQKLQALSGQLSSSLEQAYKPLRIYLQLTSTSNLEQLFTDELVSSLRFQIQHARDMNDYLLSTEQEVMITGLKVDGLQAWGRLYNELAGSLRCPVNNKEIGIADAITILFQQDRDLREQSWKAIQSAWSSQEETAAAILNAINGWRLEESRQRSGKKPLHYLDRSCHDSRIKRSTLNAMMTATWQQRSLGQRALAGMAKIIGIEKLAPWDILSPLPNPEQSDNSDTYDFKEAIDLIATAFADFDAEMGDFARMMAERNWIDALPSENRGPGAYCTKFANVREPRVFMTWDGSTTSIIILAHELGHAWHNWVMRDIPLPATCYSMTLAETASIFAETLVRDYLFRHAKNDQERLVIGWQDAVNASMMLLNIPSRFEFETRLVEARKQGYTTARELSELMTQSWEKWYEDSLSEYDPMFWASKMHFSIADLAFYNYPYLFGNLFSLGIYQQRAKQGTAFKDNYRKLLLDTGQMTAEQLIDKHLGQDIRQQAFWLNSLKTIEKHIVRFEQLIR